MALLVGEKKNCSVFHINACICTSENSSEYSLPLNPKKVSEFNIQTEYKNTFIQLFLFYVPLYIISKMLMCV